MNYNFGKLSEEEKGIVAIVRFNAAEKKTEIKKEWHIGRLRIVYHWRSSKNLWGRFGGGWNWKLGIQAGARTVIVEMLVFSLRFEWKKYMEAA